MTWKLIMFVTFSNNLYPENHIVKFQLVNSDCSKIFNKNFNEGL